jgi:hypothetical protein
MTTMAGYLQKKGQVNTAWQIRWCVLADKKIYYFKNHEQTKPLGHIPLCQSVIRVFSLSLSLSLSHTHTHTLTPTCCFGTIQLCGEDASKENCFEIVTKERIWRLAANSQKELYISPHLLSFLAVYHSYLSVPLSLLKSQRKTRERL